MTRCSVRAARSLVPPGALGTMNMTERLGFQSLGALAAAAIPATNISANTVHAHTGHFAFSRFIDRPHAVNCTSLGDNARSQSSGVRLDAGPAVSRRDRHHH